MRPIRLFNEKEIIYKYIIQREMWLGPFIPRALIDGQSCSDGFQPSKPPRALLWEDKWTVESLAPSHSCRYMCHRLSVSYFFYPSSSIPFFFFFRRCLCATSHDQKRARINHPLTFLPTLSLFHPPIRQENDIVFFAQNNARSIVATRIFAREVEEIEGIIP